MRFALRPCRDATRRGLIACRRIPHLSHSPFTTFPSHSSDTATHISPAHVIAPYLQTLLYDPSIAVTSEALGDRTLTLRNAIDAFCEGPTDKATRTALQKALALHQPQLTRDAFDDLVKTIYFVSMAGMVAAREPEKMIATHQYFFHPPDDARKPRIQKDQWIGFVKSVLVKKDADGNGVSQAVLDALFQIHRQFHWKDTFGAVASWMHFSGAVPDHHVDSIAAASPVVKYQHKISGDIPEEYNSIRQDSILAETWLYRLVLDGDVPKAPWEEVFFKRLINPRRLDTLFTLPGGALNLLGLHLYRQLVRTSRKSQGKSRDSRYGNNALLEKLKTSSVLDTFSHAITYVQHPFGFDLAATITRGILQGIPKPKKTDAEQKMCSGLINFWYQVIRFNRQVPAGWILNLFAQYKLQIPENIKKALTFRSSSPDEFRRLYERFYSEPTTLTHTDTDDADFLISVYANTVRMLCRDNPATARQIMQSETAYRVPELVHEYLRGLQETGNSSSIVRFCERTINRRIDDPYIHRLFWPYYLMALTYAKNSITKQGTRTREAVHYLFAILGAKAQLKLRKMHSIGHDKRAMPLLIKPKYPVNGAQISPRAFDRLMYNILTHGRKNVEDMGAKPQLIPLAPLQIIKLLRMAYAAKTKASEPKLQLSPYRFFQFLDDILYARVVIPRTELIQFLAKFLTLYPADQAQWQTTPPGTHFRHEYLSPPILHHLIYIGVLQAPTKPWWIVSLLRNVLSTIPDASLSASTAAPEQNPHLAIKTAMEAVLRRIYEDEPLRRPPTAQPLFQHHNFLHGPLPPRNPRRVPLSGAFRKARGQLAQAMAPQVLAEALNMVWEGVSMREVDAMLRHRGVKVARQLVFNPELMDSTKTPKSLRRKINKSAKRVRVKKEINRF